MKRLSLLLILCIFLPSLACAQVVANAADVLLPGVITELHDGDLIDLDADGVAEQIRYGVREQEESGVWEYRLVVGQTQLDGEGIYLTGRLHALRTDSSAQEVLLFLSDYGWSDDDTSYVYSYCGGSFRYLGVIPAMPWELRFTEEGMLSGSVRASILHTWFRPADFVLCTAYSDEDFSTRISHIAEMPRDLYPMGVEVTVLRDLPLVVSRTNPAHALTIKAGERALIVATDDIEWLYIVPTEVDWSVSEYGAGWLHTEIGGYSAVINGETIDTQALFDGLFYAD